jgi:hypothetical protein
MPDGSGLIGCLNIEPGVTQEPVVSFAPFIYAESINVDSATGS